MNYPPALFYDEQFSVLVTNNTHSNKFASNTNPHQTLCKKLLKFETKSPNFQINVLNWIRSLKLTQLMKYFSFNNQWIVGILHELIFITINTKGVKKYSFIPAKNDNDQIPLDTKEFSFINNPKFTDFFLIIEDGIINLSKGKGNKEKMLKKLVDNIRYVTLNDNINYTSNKDELFYYDFNNVVTLSYEYLSNLDILIQTFLEISNLNCFKNPIEIEQGLCKVNNKYYYNIKMPKWLEKQFTFHELIVAYFEQSLLINYQYYLMNKEEINFMYYDQFDELISNIYLLRDFIKNSKDKKVEIIQSVKSEEIRKILYENTNIKNLINLKKSKDDHIRSAIIGNFSCSRKHTMKTIINSTILDLEKLFLKDELTFVLNLTFMTDQLIFTTEDFVKKNIFDIINNYMKNKTAEDLILDSENNNDSSKKKKKKKKKKKDKIEEKNDEIENLNSIQEPEKKDEEDEINLDIKNDSKQVEEIPNKIDLTKENNSLDNTEKKKKKKINDEECKLAKENEEKENVKENIKENTNNVNNEIEEENETNHKKKKEFFLYPTIKDKKKKNKPNKKKNKNSQTPEKKNITTNELSKEKSNEDKSDDSTINSISKAKSDDKELVTKEESQNEDNKIIIIKVDKEYDYNSAKHKNKFNRGMKYNEINQDNYKNFNKNSDINITSKKDNYLVGSNSAKFTSFNFKSKKNCKNHKNKHNTSSPFNFLSNNVIELSKEINDNTNNVNRNKEILQKIRDKYIKNIFSKINTILTNEKINFACTLYGSSVSGLSIENSDIDIMVKIKKNINNENFVKNIMGILEQKLKEENLAYIININPIFSASVPVIKLACDLSNEKSFSAEITNILEKYKLSYKEITKLFFDITFFEVKNEQDILPSEQMIDYIKKSISVYPHIIDIVYLMKRFLFYRKLNKSYQGGISSYSLFLLTLAFFKYFKNKYEVPLGSLLIEYLNYYSNFNFYTTIIKPDKDDDLFSEIENESEYSNILKILDPITGLNVAKSTFKIDEIQDAFREGLDNIIGNLYLSNKCEELNTYDNSEKQNILDIFLTKIEPKNII